jgi:hypothetical protein
VPDDQRHYSYRVYADPAMAERFDAMRFSGPIGRLIAETQERQIAAFLAPVAGRRILDVGDWDGPRGHCPGPARCGRDRSGRVR